jgi:hypothetical protein
VSGAVRDSLDCEIHNWSFGPVTFRTQGAGLFFASDKLKARIMALSYADAKVANSAAWTQRRSAERDMGRYNNITVHGWGIYDRASHAYHVAEEVRKITWQRMQARATWGQP